MASIDINILAGGLGRTAASTDKYAGLVVYVSASIGDYLQILTGTGQATYSSSVSDADVEKIEFYISEFFRLCPTGKLYLQIRSTVNISQNEYDDLLDDAFTYADITSEGVGVVGVLLFSNSEPIYDSTAISVVKRINSVAVERQESYAEYYRVVFAFDGSTNISGLDFSPYEFDRVMYVDTYGASGTSESGRSVLGTMLGQLCSYPVHQKPSWRAHRIDDGTSWASLKSNNPDDSPLPSTQAEKDAYADNGICFAGFTPRLAGTYFDNSRMCNNTTSDFAIITHGRVVDKACGLLYDAYVTRLDGPLYVDASTGLLSADTVAELQMLGYNAISAGMIEGKSGDEVELSTDSSTGSLPQDTVYINPDQNVLSTETLNVQVSLVPVGSSKNIVINIGLTNPSIS